MLTHLTLEEVDQGALKAKAAKLSEILGRPAFVCAAEYIQNTMKYLYRLPGESESEYRCLAPLWFFLSQLKMGTCTKREPKTGGDWFYYDPTPTTTLRVVVPLLKGEHGRSENILEAYDQAGIDIDANPSRAVPVLSMHDTELVENGLTEYVQDLRHSRNRQTYKGLRFAASGGYQNPTRVETTWHLDKEARKGKYNDTPFHAVMPPGGFGEGTLSLDNLTRYVIIEQDPGDCIVCKGSSGQSRHFGTLAFGPGAYTRDLICNHCFKAFSTQVLHMLKGFPENQPITPGCWMESPTYGEVVCTEVTETIAYFRYKANKTIYENGEFVGYEEEPIWVANGDALHACSFLREADDESRHVLTLTGPYGRGEE